MCLTAACLAGAFAMVYSFVTKTMNILALERAKGNRKMQKRVKKVCTHTRIAYAYSETRVNRVAITNATHRCVGVCHHRLTTLSPRYLPFYPSHTMPSDAISSHMLLYTNPY